ncbi:MAG: hypothetical protein FJ202_05350 [Gemmatimonadetes bacterium]|nr:hypothetical protein [Gemmatimonadota bacterium]
MPQARKSLHSKVFTLALLSGQAAFAQAGQAPARDLLTYPLGLIGESAALPTTPAGAFWNPSALVATGESAAKHPSGLSGAMLSTPSDIGLRATTFGATGAFRNYAWTLSLAHVTVPGIARTESDPLTVQANVPYYSTLASAALARRVQRAAFSVAIRTRRGAIDEVARTTGALDAGVTVSGLTRADIRFAASTLMGLAFGESDRPGVNAAADARLYARDSVTAVRAGAAVVATEAGPTERYLFASARAGAWEFRGGPVSTHAYGASNVRSRAALVVRHKAFTAGVVREGGPGGLPPSYQFVVSSSR